MDLVMITAEPAPLEAISSISRRPNFMQSRFWGLVKGSLGARPMAFKLFWHGTVDSLLTICQPAAQQGMHQVYIPWAPVFQIPETHQGEFLEELSAVLTPLLPRNTLFIRYDLPWLSPYHAESPPPPDRIREIRMNFGTREKNLRKAATDIQPTHTRIINLDLDTDEILSSMKPKTRYNIRLSQRKDIRITDAPFSRLPEWYRMYEETARRNRIQLHPYRYFAELLKVTSQHNLPATRIHLLLAEQAHQPLAGMILVIHGTTATYLYGASRTTGRQCMATYRLQWEALQTARKSGCRYYDLFGIPPDNSSSHPMHGLYRFKTGFGGYTIHRRGCWDYPLLTDSYLSHSAMELAGPGYHTE